MQTPPIFNEEERLKALEEYNILDTLPEKDFDDITRIASEICQTPIALVTLLDRDRQWFKSHHGLDASETPIAYSYCAHAIVKAGEPMIVSDALKDERFHDNPLALGEPHVIFYAGIPLVNPAGTAIGSLCVIDGQARNITEDQIESLKALANQVVAQLELRKQIRLLKEAEKEIKKANEAALEERRLRIAQSSFITSHELRHEFSKILSFIHLAKTNGDVNDEMRTYIHHIGDAAHSMNTIIEKLNRKLNPEVSDAGCLYTPASALSEAEEICLVDDDPFINIVNAKVITNVLPNAPLKIFERVDGALLHIQQHPALKRFIFLDLNLPEKSGWDFLDAFRSWGVDTPVVILSSSIDPTDHNRAKTYQPVIGFYSKPLTAPMVKNLK